MPSEISDHPVSIAERLRAAGKTHHSHLDQVLETRQDRIPDPTAVYLPEPSAWRVPRAGTPVAVNCQALQPWPAMTWATVLTSLFILLSLTALVVWLVLYIRFRNSAEKRWATQVLTLLRDAERRVRSENRQLHELKAQRDAKAHALHEEVFAAHLRDYSVDELEAYPGIGPATVGKLRAAGFVNLATLNRARIRIPRLGEKRLADINKAIRELLRKARNTFDEGGGRQAPTLLEQRETLSAHYDRLEAQARRRARAAEDFIGHLGKTIEYARSVKLWRWLRPTSNESLIPSEVMQTPLPVLETALREAEYPITRNGTPVPEIAPSPKTANPTQDECLTLLEIPPNTPLSAELVRRQWDLWSERLDPEKMTSLGTEFVTLAQTKLARLRRAAESLLDTMGEKLEAKPTTPPVPELRHNPDLDDVFGGM